MSDGMSDAYHAGLERARRLGEARARRKGIHKDCPQCEMPIEKPGGLVISPPDADGVCKQTQVCSECWVGVEYAAGIRKRYYE
jgi:hypothetical protein